MGLIRDWRKGDITSSSQIGGGKYLHLFYEDAMRGQDPYAVINTAKQAMLQSSISKIRSKATASKQIEKEFEQLYAIKEHQFADAGINTRIKYVNKVLGDFDAAIAELKRMIKDGDDVATAVIQSNRVIETIDKILQYGANTGGLGDSSYYEVMQQKQEMQTILSTLKYAQAEGLTSIDAKTVIGTNTKGEDKTLLGGITSVQSNASGYGWELGLVYAFIGSNQFGLDEIHRAMINIGGAKTSAGLSMYQKIDPKMEQDIAKLTNALNSNISQPKADLVYNLNMSNGNGTLTMTSRWAGFQAKNFQELSIGVSDSFSLGELGITKYYAENFLVNVAGTLAGRNWKATNIPKTLNKNPYTTQGFVDNVWQSIKNSARILAIADGIAGRKRANITNKVNYYVIRSKTTGTARVISVSEILRTIANRLNKGDSSVLGINTGQGYDSSRGEARGKFWSINVGAYSEEDHSGQTRSDIAYGQILSAILESKISISLNFSSWF